MVERLKLGFLGKLEISLEGEEVRIPSQKVRALLAYLAMEAGKSHDRSFLAGMFWPDSSEKSARDSLRQTISLLRGCLDDRKREPAFLEADRQTLSFSLVAEDVVDVFVFQESLRVFKAAKEQGDVSLSALETCAALYHGPFLVDLLEDGEGFGEWLRHHRLHLQRDALLGLGDLAEAYAEQARWEEAEAIALRQLLFEASHERAHVQLMKVYAQQGRRTDALRQYELCFEHLREELGVRPSAQTIALHEQILADAYPKKADFPAFSGAITAKKDVKVEDTHTKAQELAAESGSKRGPLWFEEPKGSTRFVGRERELAELVGWLEEGTRLITILGMGGMGKTRLAQRLAVRAQEQFMDGAAYVSLVGVTSLEPLVGAIAEATGVSFGEGSTPQQQLLAALQSSDLLLVLDNMEQLLHEEVRGFLGSLLSNASGLRLLVTSRERLHLRDERLYPLRGIGEIGRDEDAVTCFLGSLPADKVAEVQSKDFLGKVHQICSRVEWIPLAIELAAALLSVFSLDEILGELEQDGDILASEVHEFPARHRSLRLVFSQSWESLSDEEKLVFARCSVFRGGFTLEAAREVVGAKAQQIAQLVGKSLIRKKGEKRYEIHELLRQYAAEKLVERDVRQGHALYYTEWMARRLFEALGEIDLYDFELSLRVQDKEALQQIAADMENLDAAWRWGLQHGSLPLVTRQIEGILLFLRYHQRWSELVELLELALKRFPARASEPLRSALWCYFLGLSHWNMGALQEALSYFHQAAEWLGFHFPSSRWGKVRLILQSWLGRSWDRLVSWILRKRATWEEQMVALLRLKIHVQLIRLVAHSSMGALDAVSLLFSSRRVTFLVPQDRASLALFYAQWSLFGRKAGRLREAQQSEVLALQLCERKADPVLEAYAHFFIGQGKAGFASWDELLFHVGFGGRAVSPSFHRGQWLNSTMVSFLIHFHQGDYKEALACCRTFQKHALHEEDAVFLLSLVFESWVRGIQGELDEALGVLCKVESLAHFRSIFPAWQCGLHVTMAWWLVRKGELAKAWEQSKQAILLLKTKLGVVTAYSAHLFSTTAEVFSCLMMASKTDERLDRAEVSQGYKEAMGLLRSFGRIYPIGRPTLYLQEGRLAWEQGRREKAEKYWDMALPWARQVEMPFEEGCVALEMGKCLGGENTKGREMLDLARQIFSRLGCRHDLGLVETLLEEKAR